MPPERKNVNQGAEIALEGRGGHLYGEGNMTQSDLIFTRKESAIKNQHVKAIMNVLSCLLL